MAKPSYFVSVAVPYPDQSLSNRGQGSGEDVSGSSAQVPGPESSLDYLLHGGEPDDRLQQEKGKGQAQPQPEQPQEQTQYWPSLSSPLETQPGSALDNLSFLPVYEDIERLIDLVLQAPRRAPDEDTTCPLPDAPLAAGVVDVVINSLLNPISTLNMQRDQIRDQAYPSGFCDAVPSDGDSLSSLDVMPDTYGATSSSSISSGSSSNSFCASTMQQQQQQQQQHVPQPSLPDMFLPAQDISMPEDMTWSPSAPPEFLAQQDPRFSCFPTSSPPRPTRNAHGSSHQPWGCSQCNTKFKTQELLRDHERAHAPPPPGWTYLKPFRIDAPDELTLNGAAQSNEREPLFLLYEKGGWSKRLAVECNAKTGGLKWVHAPNPEYQLTKEAC